MTINLDVLGLFMEDRIGGNVNDCLAVTIKRNRERNGNLEILNELTEPFEFI